MHYFVYMERLINDFNEDCLLLSLIKPHAYGNTENTSSIFVENGEEFTQSLV